jgi:2-keto-4-pentenoate hydratase
MDRAAADRVLAAAASLARARARGERLTAAPEAERLSDLREAEAAQTATFTALGLDCAGWKVSRAGSAPFSAPMPAVAPPPPRGAMVEFELALRFRRDLAPAEIGALTPDRLPEVADLAPLFEIVFSRFAPDAAPSALARAADCQANHGFVVGAAADRWDREALEAPRARLWIDGVPIASHAGPHPALPFGPLVEAWRNRLAACGTGLRAGAVLTLGSLTGMLPLPERGGLLRGEIDGVGVLEHRAPPLV